MTATYKIEVVDEIKILSPLQQYLIFSIKYAVALKR